MVDVDAYGDGVYVVGEEEENNEESGNGHEYWFVRFEGPNQFFTLVVSGKGLRFTSLIFRAIVFQ